MWSLSLSLSFSHFYLFYFLSKSTNASFHLLNLDVFFGVSQVLGYAKGAVAVVVSILIFRNPVSVTGMLGYSLTVFGVILYSEAKKRSKWQITVGIQILSLFFFMQGPGPTSWRQVLVGPAHSWCPWILPPLSSIFFPGSPGWPASICISNSHQSSPE